MFKFPPKNIKVREQIRILAIILVSAGVFLVYFFYNSQINEARIFHQKAYDNYVKVNYTIDGIKSSTIHSSKKLQLAIVEGISPVSKFQNRKTEFVDIKIENLLTQLFIQLERTESISVNEVIIKLTDIENLAKEKANLSQSSINNLLSERNNLNIVFGISFIIFLLFDYKFWNKHINHPVKKIRTQLTALISGDFKQNNTVTGNTELSEISISIDKIRGNIRNITEFIKRIGDGNFNTADLALGNNDLLGDSLIQMQQRIQTVAEEDKRRNWVNEGLAKFSDILRKHRDDLNELSDDIVYNLAKYLNVNQAAMFFLNEENNEQFLETASSYAWSRKKHFKMKFGLKENLIGQSILDKDHIYLSDVPDDFVIVSSGLGKANPREVLIVPMIVNDEPQGVIEIASFNRFEPFMIEFVEKVCENIAATIVSIRTNYKTRVLLQESQDMTKQLKQQEENLRKNTEELSKAKEHLDVQLDQAKHEMEMQIQKIDAEKRKNIAILEGCEDGVITFKNNGVVDFFNKAAEEIWQITRENVLGKHIRSFIPLEIKEDHDVSNVFYMGEGDAKPISSRTEITVFDSNGQEISVLATLSIGKLEEDSTFALFIQRISVEFF